jgi:hypothetical protein
MIGSEPTRPQPVSTDAEDAGPMIGTDMPALHLGCGTDTLPEPTLPVLDAPQPEVLISLFHAEQHVQHSDIQC